MGGTQSKGKLLAITRIHILEAFSITLADVIALFDSLIKPIDTSLDVNPLSCDTMMKEILQAAEVDVETVEDMKCDVSSCSKAFTKKALIYVLKRLGVSSNRITTEGCERLKVRLRRACVSKRAALLTKLILNARPSPSSLILDELKITPVIAVLATEPPTYYHIKLRHTDAVYLACDEIVRKMTDVFQSASVPRNTSQCLIDDIHSWILIHCCDTHYRKKMEPTTFETSDLNERFGLADGILLDSEALLVPGCMLTRRTDVSSMADHYGIYLGVFFEIPIVVDLDTDDQNTATVTLRTLSEFSGKFKLKVTRLKDVTAQIKNNKGVVCFAAQAMVGQSHRYKLLNANCESFASALYFGSAQCSQTPFNSEIKTETVRELRGGKFEKLKCVAPLRSETSLKESRVYSNNSLGMKVRLFGRKEGGDGLETWSDIRVFSKFHSWDPAIYQKEIVGNVTKKCNISDGTDRRVDPGVRRMLLTRQPL
jgi:hypothetical protein